MSISFWNIGWHMLSILLLMLLFKRYLLKPVRAFMAKRAAQFAQEREQIQTQQAQIADEQKQIALEHRTMQQQASDLMAKSQQESKVQAQQIVEQAQQEARGILNNAQKQSEAMHDQALQQAQKELTALSVQIAGRVLEREVKPEDHARMVEEFLSEVKS